MNEIDNVSCGRVVWIDVAKAIAIISVILGHTFSYGSSIHSFVYSFHIPLFFLLSGYTFKVRKPSFSKMFNRILLPYLLICVLSFLVSLRNNVFDGNSLFSFLVSVVFAAGGPTPLFSIPGVGIAWFLAALFIAKIYFAFSQLLFDKYQVRVWLQLIFYFIGSYLSWKIARHLFLPFALLQGVCASLYLFIGYKLHYFLGGGLNKLRILCIGIACGVIWIYLLSKGCFYSIGNFFCFGSIFIGILMSLSSSVAVSLIIRFVSQIVFSSSSFLVHVGRDSLLLLCIHQFETYFIDWLSITSGCNSISGEIAFGILHVAIVLVFYILICCIGLNYSTKSS